jgi:hypothetical protein
MTLKTSNKKFGYFFSGIFVILTIQFFRKNYVWGSTILGCISILFFLVATFCPSYLKLLNHIWYRLGIILGKFVNPIVTGILFFIIITPVALFLRMIGRDELLLKLSSSKTYWVLRKQPGPSPESFREMF